jgi:AraC-like DNA-binding protein
VLWNAVSVRSEDGLATADVPSSDRSMSLLTYSPKPPLSDFVDVLWLMERAAASPARERLMPMPTAELIVHLRATSSGLASTLCGPQSESFVIDLAPRDSVLGVHFKPGGAHPFFAAPAGELRDLRVPLDLLWGGRAAELSELLLEAPTASARFRTIERFLLMRAVRPLRRHPAVDFALRAFDRDPSPSVATVVERTGWSQRHFIDVFRDHVGLTPKLFGRVARFQRVVREIHGARQADWAAVAARCGYYDQSHFIHDFQEFSSFSPTAYWRRRGEKLNHVPLPADQGQ